MQGAGQIRSLSGVCTARHLTVYLWLEVVMVRRKSFPTHILVFLAPAVIIYTIFMVYPLLNSLRMSFFTFSPDSRETFVGLDNYVQLFTNQNFAPRFWGALKNNFIFFAIIMVVQNSIALLLAALIANDRRRFANFYRTIFFMPSVLSFVIIGFIWNLILNPLWGVTESMLDFVYLGFL